MTYWPEWMTATATEIREAHGNNGYGFCKSSGGMAWYPTHPDDVIDLYRQDGRLLEEAARDC